MPRLPIVLLSVLLVGSAPAELHRLGFVPEDLARVAPEREVRSIAPAAGAPEFRDMPRVDLGGELPPVGNQGAQGSCASWAIAYYHRTQLEFRERRWNLADPNHQFSPAFCYNQVNGGADRGSGFSNNMGLVCDQGCASMFDCPYDQYNYTRWPSESAYSHAIPYRTKDWAWFRVYDTTRLNMVKQLLANGSTATLAIAVWGNFDNISLYNNTYCSRDRTGSNRGGHLVTFVGYDDTMTTHDGIGAFRMVNSWGAGWGAQGYFWMSYEAISDGYLSEGAVGFLTDTVGYVPRLVARVHVSHPTRDRVGLGFAVGPRYGALWLKDFRQWRDVGVDQPFPENKMVFDLTDAEPFIASGQTDSVYFGAADYRRDNRTGTIQHVSIQHLDWGTIFESDSTPRAIPDDGAPAEVGMTIAELDHDVSATWVFRPSGKVEPGVGLVPTVEVRNFGAVTAAFTVALAIGGSYHDTAQVTGLAHAQAETVSFLPWTPQARETVVVRCTTALPGDEYPENDACVAWAFSRYTDAAVAGIVVPADTTDSGEVVRPQVRVCNNSTQTESFFVTFMIPSASYLRTARATVAADSEALVQFTPWTPVVPGSHALRCTLELSGDMDAGNNSLTGTVYVRPGAGLFEAGSALVPAAPAGSVSPDGRLVIRLGSQMAGSPLRAAVCDAAGRLHLRQEWNAGRRSSDVTLDLHSLAPGAYLCRIESGTTSTTVKFIKTR